MEGERTTRAPVRVELSLDFIYRNSLLRIAARSARPFTLRCLTGTRGGPRLVPALVAQLDAGIEGDGELLGDGPARTDDAESPSDARVSALLATGFSEKVVKGSPQEAVPASGDEQRVPAPILPDVRKRRSQRAGTQYGMRFYPFVSSTLEISLSVAPATLRTLVVRLSSGVRPVTYAELGVGEAAIQPVDTTTGDDVVLIYDIPPTQRASTVNLTLPVRTGGPRLARAYNYPLMYWTAGLIGIALTARLKPSFTEAAVAALAVFLLQQWRQHERPQRISLLHGLYVAGALLAIPWGIIWTRGGTVVCLLASLLLFSTWVSGVRVILRFERSGDLPRPLAVVWSATARLLERGA